MTGEACSVCSAELTQGANYCTQCGASSTATVISFDEETTEDSPGDTEVAAKSFASRVAVAVGLLALVGLVGSFVLGGSSPRDDEGTPEPTSPTAEPTADEETETTRRETPPLPEARAGEPLVWERQLELGQSETVGLVTHQEQVFVFTTSLDRSFGAFFESNKAGLAAHVLRDGNTWIDLGEVIAPPATVSQVVSSDFGLLAAGTDAKGNTALWVSRDGMKWEHRLIEQTPPDTYPKSVFYVGANDEAILVVGNGSFGYYYDELRAAVKAELTVADRDFSLTIGEDRFTAYGPLGLVLGSWSFEELDLTAPDPAAELEDGPSVWRSPDTESWQSTELPGENAGALSVDGTGSFQLLSWGDQQELWLSTDGLNWTEGTLMIGVTELATTWQEYELAPNNGGFRYRADIHSDSARQSLAELFPDGRSWYPGQVHTDDDGVVLTFWPDQSDDTTQTVLVVEGHRLSTENGGLEIEPPDGPEFAVQLWRPTEDLSYRFIDATASMLFTNPNDGTTLEVSLSDLQLLDSSIERSVSPTQLAYSSDLVTWSVGAVGPSASSEGNAVFDVALTPSHVVALSWEFETSSRHPVASIWSATRPAR